MSYQVNDQNLRIFSWIKFGNSVVWDYEYVVAIIVSSWNVNEEEFRQKTSLEESGGSDTCVFLFSGFNRAYLLDENKERKALTAFLFNVKIKKVSILCKESRKWCSSRYYLCNVLNLTSICKISLMGWG